MSLRPIAVAALLASCSSSPPDLFGADTRRRGIYGPIADPVVLVDAHIGLRTFRTESDWDPLDDPLDFGLTFRTPVQGFTHLDWDLGLRYAYDRLERAAEDFELQVFELNAGAALRLGAPGDQLQPYIGGGLALVVNDLERHPDGLDPTGARESSFGPYARAGVQVEFAPAQLVGLEIRYVAPEEAELDGFSRDTHATTVALTFGARF